jgi:hypothetical protein
MGDFPTFASTAYPSNHITPESYYIQGLESHPEGWTCFNHKELQVHEETRPMGFLRLESLFNRRIRSLQICDHRLPIHAIASPSLIRQPRHEAPTLVLRSLPRASAAQMADSTISAVTGNQVE